jgi:uncharacterized protein (TIGR00369 family)
MALPTFSPDDEQRVRSSFAKQAVMQELGVSLDAVGPGTTELSFTHDDRFTQQHGFVHAGILTTVLDSACGYAAFSLMPPDASVLTVDFHVNLLRPARAERYRVSAGTVKNGRTLTVCTADIRSADRPDSEPFAVMTATLITLVGAGLPE